MSGPTETSSIPDTVTFAIPDRTEDILPLKVIPGNTPSLIKRETWELERWKNPRKYQVINTTATSSGNAAPLKWKPNNILSWEVLNDLPIDISIIPIELHKDSLTVLVQNRYKYQLPFRFILDTVETTGLKIGIPMEGDRKWVQIPYSVPVPMLIDGPWWKYRGLN